MRGYYERPKPADGAKKTVKVVLLTLLVLILAVAAAGAIYYKSMLGKVNKVNISVEYTTEATKAAETEPSETIAVETTEEPATEATTEPHIASSADYINFLVVGQAGREGETERFADSTVLLTLNTYEKTLTMTSILRDSFIKMPDYKGHTGGRIKLTTIYHLGYIYAGNEVSGSMELMDLTLYNNFGIEVDYNFEINFDGFIDIINEMGGLDIELTQAEADYLNDYIQDEECIWNKYTVSEGENHLEGWAALAYARMRKAAGDGESDIKRTSRQQKVISSLMQKVKGMSLSELQSLANMILPLITTSMDDTTITQMLTTMLPMLTELELKSGGTCPAEYSGDLVDIYGDGVTHSVLRFDEASTKKTMRALTEGETN